MNRIEIIDENELDYIKIYCCDSEKVSKSCIYGPTIRNHHLIHYIFSGKGKVSLYGKSYECKAGTLIWIPSYTPVTYVADDSEPWNYAWIGISGGESDILCNELHFSLKNPIRQCALERLDYYFKKMVDQYKEDDNIARLKTLSVFYKIVAILPQCNELVTKESEKLLEKSLDIIKDNYWNLKVSDIADSLGIDRSYLYKIFIEHLNISPKKYLKEYRLSVAYELLRSGNYSIIQVSKAVGFESASTFSTAFKNKYLVSPSEHIKQNKGKKKDW